ERDLREKEPCFEIAPRVLEALEDLRSHRCMRSTGREVVGVDRNERKEPFTCRFAAGIHQLAERRACRERSRTCRVHFAGAMIGMTKHDIALRNAEAVTNRIECLSCMNEQITRATETSYRRLDHRKQDEALRSTEHVAHVVAT